MNFIRRTPLLIMALLTLASCASDPPPAPCITRLVPINTTPTSGGTHHDGQR